MYNKMILGCLLTAGLSVSYSSHAQINVDATRGKLSTVAKFKVTNAGIDLDALLKNESNDLIVEYNVDQPSTKTPAQIREYYKQRKQQFQAGFKKVGGFELLRDYNALPVSFHRIKNKDTLVQLLNSANVKAVYPNRKSRTTTTQSYQLIGQQAVAAKGFTGEGTSVAVLDTGTNYAHQDFGSCTSPATPNTCRISHSLELAEDDGSLDDNGHGSNVAGIVSKVAPNAKIVAMDVFRGELAHDSDIISGLNWVVNNAETLNIKSVNLSIGDNKNYGQTCENSGLKQSFENLGEKGVIPVVAAGNDSFTNGLSYPACTAGGVSVGAVYDSNVGGVGYKNCSDSSSFSDKVTCFSNSSPNLTLLAPGVMMEAGGVTQSGTSQATPHVAAAIAVLSAANAFPTETIEQRIERLKTSGDLVTDHRNSQKTPRLNLLNALSSLM